MCIDEKNAESVRERDAWVVHGSQCVGLRATPIPTAADGTTPIKENDTRGEVGEYTKGTQEERWRRMRDGCTSSCPFACVWERLTPSPLREKPWNRKPRAAVVSRRKSLSCVCVAEHMTRRDGVLRFCWEEGERLCLYPHLWRIRFSARPSRVARTNPFNAPPPPPHTQEETVQSEERGKGSAYVCVCV